MSVGDSVRVLEPFKSGFPDVYVIEEIRADGTCHFNGTDFAPEYLEKV